MNPTPPATTDPAPTAPPAPAAAPTDERGPSDVVKMLGDLLAPLTVGSDVTYRDTHGVDHPALVTKIVNGNGLVNLVEFGVHKGDEATRFIEGARYAPAATHGCWRWPESKRQGA